MAQYFEIHPDNPQSRLIAQAVNIIQQGGVIAYPTDSSYAFGCQIGNKAAMKEIIRIRETDQNHNFTLVCGDLSELSHYAKVSNENYRLMKRFTPGPYTFILSATKEVPKRLQNPKKRSIGLRVPNFPVVQSLLQALGEPILSSTLWLPNDDFPLNDGADIRERLEHQIELVIDSGPCELQPTTVVSLLNDIPEILRAGHGNVEI